MSETEVLKEGDTVLLRGPEQSFLLRLSRGPQEVERSGVLDLSSHIGQRPGGFVIWAGRDYRLLKPGLPDFFAHLRRSTQVVTPKDAMQLLYLA
ncbi:MAG: hypothetical protein WCA77_00425, partial [Thermoplasmata archaeon]